MNRLKWYALQVYTGHEDKIKTSLEARIKLAIDNAVLENTPLALIKAEKIRKAIDEIYIPKNKTIKRSGKDNKVKEVEEKMYSGYIFVHANLDNEIWHLLKDTDGVIGFIGNGIMGQSIDDADMEKIKASVSDSADTYSITLKEGDTVNIKSGPFEGNTGIIQEINIHKLEARILVDMNGNQVPVTLNYESLEK